MLEPPAATAVAAIPAGKTTGADGDITFPTAAPLPTCPAASSPQHVTSPLPNNAHVWRSPAAIAVAYALGPPGNNTVDAGADTSTASEPSPS